MTLFYICASFFTVWINTRQLDSPTFFSIQSAGDLKVQEGNVTQKSI